MTQAEQIVGVDVSAETLDVTCWLAGRYTKAHRVTNSPEGFGELQIWLEKQGVTRAAAVFCLEATGVYAEALCYWLACQGYRVAVEAPHRTKRAFYPLGAKSDPLDSRQLAEYGWRFFDQLNLWKPPEEVLEQVKTLLTTREQLVGQSTACRNSLQALQRKVVRTYLAEQTLHSTLTGLKEQIRRLDEALKQLMSNHPGLHAGALLLMSIPGVGWLLAAHWAVITEGFQKVLDPRQASAYLGMCPLENSSGKAVWRQASSRGIGPRVLRKLLHLAAWSLRTHDARFKAYYLRKREAGKATRLIFNNIGNKLIHVICAVLRTNTRYIANHKSVPPHVLATA
jgi:transposase